MYESPITLISGAFHLNLEDGVYKAVRQTGVVVDKDELIKALKYDRGQYEKGYADAKAEQKKGEWINDGKGLYKCTSCGELWTWCWACCVPLARIYKELKYCPKCGAKMEEEEREEE